MAVLPAGADGGQLLAGTGGVTLSRAGGGAGFGAYALLFTTRLVPGGGVEAVIAVARPQDTDPAWGLVAVGTRPHPKRERNPLGRTPTQDRSLTSSEPTRSQH